MPEIKKRFFVFAQVPEKYLERFIKKMEDNPKVGKVLEYYDVWFVGKGTEFSKALPGAEPIGKEVEPSVMWIGSCEPEDAEEVMGYVSNAHPWEVPMVYGRAFDFTIPTREERKRKHEQQKEFKN